VLDVKLPDASGCCARNSDVVAEVAKEVIRERKNCARFPRSLGRIGLLPKADSGRMREHRFRPFRGKVVVPLDGIAEGRKHRRQRAV
jgi:hypothetical protein